MLVFEAKLQGTDDQYGVIDEMIRTARFVRNKCLRYWLDNKGVNGHDLNKYCRVLRQEFPFVEKLNSQARQASAERAWIGISRFYKNCRKGVPSKKGFPKFKKHRTHGSVEYKTTGWKLSSDRREITFTDKFNAGTFRLWGTRDLHFYQIQQIKRVRIVRRVDGYYVQFAINQERNESHTPKHRNIGLDMGLNHFYTDSEGNKVENPRFLRKAEKAIRKRSRVVSLRHRKPAKKGEKIVQSNNYKKALNRLGRKHLKVSRQRKDFACKLARCVILSNDVVALEDLKVASMVKNHHLAKSINDAAWSQFRQWLEYFGKVFGVPVIAVPPHFTSQDCSNCGQKVEKSLLVRTHFCRHCGYIADRDWNAAINILQKALEQLARATVGHTGSYALDVDKTTTSECKTSSRETERGSLSRGNSSRKSRNPPPQRIKSGVQPDDNS